MSRTAADRTTEPARADDESGQTANGARRPATDARKPESRPADRTPPEDRQPANGQDDQTVDSQEPNQQGQKQEDQQRGRPPEQKQEQKPKVPLYKRPLFGVIVGVVLVTAIVVALWYFMVGRYHVTTDDAFVTAHSSTVSPRISGQVTQVVVDDNWEVKKGDLLVVLDDRDYVASLKSAQASLAVADAQLSQAQAQTASARAQVAQAKADVNAAQATAQQAESDLDRYLSVLKIDPRAVSKQQVDQAQNNARNTAAQVAAAKEKELAAEAQVRLGEAQTQSAHAQIEKAKADVDNAQLQLSYTRITADQDGQVTNRTVEVGNDVSPGTALMAIVPLQVWVTANYKETQLRNIRVGQKVKVHVDSYDIDIDGHVDSIQAGSGAVFSLLPPENATGNYVKVVQRIPVKIVLDQIPRDFRLTPGMSVEPTVYTK